MYQENTLGMGMGGGVFGLIAVLVVLFLFGGGNFNGNNQQNTIEVIKGQQAIQNQMSQNAMSQIVNANANNVAQLGGLTNINNAIGQQTAALQLMGANIAAQQQSCCCETQKELLRMSGADQLAICKQTNEIENNITANSNLIRGDLKQLGYDINQSAAAIIAANNAGVQAIKDLCNNHWVQDLQQKYNDAKNELSQNQQTLAITTQLNAVMAAIAKIPTTATAGA